MEDLSHRTESVSVFANPDGTFTRRDFGAAVRVKQSGKWVPIDYTLVEQADGSYAPKASDVDITIGGGSAREAARVQLDGDESLAFTWPTDLPEPVVDGGVATYKLSETSDLVVAVTGNGVTARIRLNEEPTTDDPAFNLGLRADSLDLEQKPTTGALEITDQDGKTVGGAEQLLAWDSATDKAGDPSNVVELDANLKQTSATGDVTNHSLELTAPDGFLSDPQTEYPVTIDPNIRVGGVRDTWVRSGQATTYGDDFRLIVGKVNGSDNTNPARSYLKFFDSRVDTNPNVKVTSATLSLWQYYGYSCTDRRMYAMAAGSAWGDNLSWGGSMPGGTGTAASVDDNRGASDCGQGWTKLDVTSIANAWNTGAIDNNGFRLHAGDETLSAFERRFCSMDPVSSESICKTATRSPVLETTYNTYPYTAAQPSVSLSSSSAALSAIVSDPDGGSVRARFIVKRGSTVAYDGYSSFVASGSSARVTVPNLADGSYTVQAWSNDGALDAKTASAASTFTVDNSPGSVTKVIVSAEENPAAASVTITDATAHPVAIAFEVRQDDLVEASGTTPFSTLGGSSPSTIIQLSTPSLTEGRHVLRTRATDSAGRHGAWVETSFDVDQPDAGALVAVAQEVAFSTDDSSPLQAGETRTIALRAQGSLPDDPAIAAVTADVRAAGQAEPGTLTLAKPAPVTENPDDQLPAEVFASINFAAGTSGEASPVLTSLKPDLSGDIEVTNNSNTPVSLSITPSAYEVGPDVAFDLPELEEASDDGDETADHDNIDGYTWDPAQSVEPEIPIESEDPPVTLRTTPVAFFGWVDNAHQSKTNPGYVQVHGWWTAADKRAEKRLATIKVEVQLKIKGKWRTVGYKKKKHLKPGMGSGINGGRPTAARKCNKSDDLREWRGRSDTDIEGVPDSKGWAYSPHIASMRCK